MPSVSKRAKQLEAQGVLLALALTSLAAPMALQAQTAATPPRYASASASASSPVALPDIEAIAARFAPIVVNISVTGTRNVSTRGDAAPTPGDEAEGAQGADETDAMRDFLRNFQQRFGGLPPQLKPPVRAEGLASSSPPMA